MADPQADKETKKSMAIQVLKDALVKEAVAMASCTQMHLTKEAFSVKALADNKPGLVISSSVDLTDDLTLRGGVQVKAAVEEHVLPAVKGKRRPVNTFKAEMKDSQLVVSAATWEDMVIGMESSLERNVVTIANLKSDIMGRDR